MKTLLYFVCHETKKYIWIGRNTNALHKSGAREGVIIFNDNPVGPFLNEHLGKEIVMVSEHVMEGYPDYKQVRWEDYLENKSS